MNRFDAREEKEMYEILDRMTSKNDFWAVEKPIPEKTGFQRFGLQLREEDFEQGGHPHNGFLVRDRNEARKASSGFSVVRNGEKEFRVELDVWPFKRDELSVMVVPGKYFTVKGEHELKFEDNSECTRQFQRYYCLPKGSNSDTLESSYCNGILTVKVDKQAVSDEPEGPRIVQIDLVANRKNEGVSIEDRYTPVEPTEVREVAIELQDKETVVETSEEVPVTGDLKIDNDLYESAKKECIEAILINEDLNCPSVLKVFENLRKAYPANKALKSDDKVVEKAKDSS